MRGLPAMLPRRWRQPREDVAPYLGNHPHGMVVPRGHHGQTEQTRSPFPKSGGHGPSAKQRRPTPASANVTPEGGAALCAMCPYSVVGHIMSVVCFFGVLLCSPTHRGCREDGVLPPARGFGVPPCGAYLAGMDVQGGRACHLTKRIVGGTLCLCALSTEPLLQRCLLSPGMVEPTGVVRMLLRVRVRHTQAQPYPSYHQKEIASPRCAITQGVCSRVATLPAKYSDMLVGCLRMAGGARMCYRKPVRYVGAG